MNKDSRSIPAHLSDFLDWLDIEKGLSAKSQENYARFLGRFLSWLKKNNLQNIKPHELTSDHVWKYRVFLSRQYRSKSNAVLKRSTQNYYLIAVRSLLNYFADRDIISLPSEKIKLAKDKKEKQVRFLNLDQIEKLVSVIKIDKIQGLRDRAILEVLFSTGMRIAELAALNRNQFKNLAFKRLELGIIGKGGRARTVYFSERSLEWLGKYLKTRNDDNKPLFINYRRRNGTDERLSVRYMEKMIKRYALLAGLPSNTTPHVMRHSFASDLLSQGVDLRIIQEFLGHKNISATQIYTHVTSKKLRDIHRRFHAADNTKE